MWALVEEGETGMFAGSGSGCSATIAGMGNPHFQGMGQKGLVGQPACAQASIAPPTFYLLLQA